MTRSSCFKLVLAYDGTAFSGWEKQAQGERTVRGIIEAGLQSLTRSQVSVFASGRTDSGVHALGQTVSFHLNKDMDENTIVRGLNALLPRDVLILKALRVPDDFHARYSARYKTYFYQILEGQFDDPFKSRFYHRMAKLPPVEKIRRCTSILVGKRDFSAMQATGSDVRTTVRNLMSIKIRSGRGWVRIFFTADGFLYRMVRNMVSLLVALASGAISYNSAEEILASGDRSLAPPTFPGKGLFMWKVYY